MLKLIKLKIFPKKPSGLKSNTLVFGNHFTQLYGENGCGKSPLIQSILYCLGLPCEFRQIIYDKCEHVKLMFSINDEYYTVKRYYLKNETDIELKSNEITQQFFNESEFSQFIFSQLNLRLDNLVSNKKKSVQPYLSSILPIFYLNQEDGYNTLYSAEKSFIKDQLSEMIRIIFDLPIKNPFDSKKLKLEAKNNLDSTSKRLHEHTLKLNTERKNLSVDLESSEELRRKIDKLEDEYELLKKSGASQEDSVRALDQLIIMNSRKIQENNDRVNLLSQRNSSVEQIISEIEVEIETLNLNESSRKIFHSFDDMCGTENCQMFANNSQDYSKNLLYLKDQIKDLKNNNTISLREIEILNEQKKVFESTIQDIEQQKKEAIKSSEVSALIDSMSEIKNQIFEFQSTLFEIERFETIERQNLQYVIDRDKAQEKYSSYSESTRTQTSVIEFKNKFTKSYIRWLKVLDTPNIDTDISFDNNFKPVLGQEKVKQLKGSTRTRAVLAYHSALFEMMCNQNAISFGFLIFDTPRQHELNDGHLDNYLNKLKELCQNYNVQIVFSTSTYRYSLDKDDSEWIPEYEDKADKKIKFLLDTTIVL